MAYLEKSIAAVNPKGGEWKTTCIQTVSSSPVFAGVKIRILEVDSQGSISDWLYERKAAGLPPIDIELVRYDGEMKIKDAINKYKKGTDILFLDLPGESKAAEKTRGALAYADIVLIPIRPSDKAIRAFENNLLPMVRAVAEIRGKEPFWILPTFAHPGADREKYRQIFAAYGEDVNIMDNIHRDRQIFTYFSQGGMTLEEYAKASINNKTESRAADNATEEVNLIATELWKALKDV